jgi:hypothetical protein
MTDVRDMDSEAYDVLQRTSEEELLRKVIPKFNRTLEEIQRQDGFLS